MTRTHLRDDTTMMAWNDLELHSASHLSVCIRLAGLRYVPETDIVNGGAVVSLR